MQRDIISPHNHHFTFHFRQKSKLWWHTLKLKSFPLILIFQRCNYIKWWLLKNTDCCAAGVFYPIVYNWLMGQLQLWFPLWTNECHKHQTVSLETDQSGNSSQSPDISSANQEPDITYDCHPTTTEMTNNNNIDLSHLTGNNKTIKYSLFDWVLMWQWFSSKIRRRDTSHHSWLPWALYLCLASRLHALHSFCCLCCISSLRCQSSRPRQSSESLSLSAFNFCTIFILISSCFNFVKLFFMVPVSSTFVLRSFTSSFNWLMSCFSKDIS